MKWPLGDNKDPADLGLDLGLLTCISPFCPYGFSNSSWAVVIAFPLMGKPYSFPRVRPLTSQKVSTPEYTLAKLSAAELSVDGKAGQND